MRFLPMIMRCHWYFGSKNIYSSQFISNKNNAEKKIIFAYRCRFGFVFDFITLIDTFCRYRTGPTFTLNTFHRNTLALGTFFISISISISILFFLLAAIRPSLTASLAVVIICLFVFFRLFALFFFSSFVLIFSLSVLFSFFF